MEPNAQRMKRLPTRSGSLKPVKSAGKRSLTGYLFGGVGGLALGLLSTYFFHRASNENEEGPQPIQTAQLFGLALTLVTVLRQIAEMGKPPHKRGRG